MSIDKSAVHIGIAAFFVLVHAAWGFVDGQETWAENDLAGWSHGSSGVGLTNPGGYLNMVFHRQNAPSCVSDIARGQVAPGTGFDGFSFRLCAFDILPSAVRVYFHSSESGNSWYVPLSLSERGSWKAFNLPLEFSAGWIMGPNSSAEQFLRDIESIDWAGIYLRRHGDVAAQNYGIDDSGVST